MKAGDSKLCPSCGLKNKPKWEFCARCGESLQDVAVGASSADVTDEPVVAAGAAPGASQVLSWIGTAAAILITCVVALRWRPAQAATDPGIFVGPQADPAPAVALADPADEPVPTSLRDGQAALFTGDFKAALRALADAVNTSPNDPAIRYAYAQALWQTGDRDAALDQYRRAAALSPDTANYVRDYAKALVAAGRGVEAIPQYEAALRIQPESPGYMKELAALYMQTGNTQGAIDLLRRAVAMKGGDPQLLQDLGQALERSGNKAGAAQTYQAILAANPKDATARALLSEIVFAEGRQEEAIMLVREGLASGGSPALYRALASLLERNGRTQEAAENYREYAQRAASAPDAAAMAERARILEQSASS